MNKTHIKTKACTTSKGCASAETVVHRCHLPKHMAVAGNPGPKVVLKLSTSTLGSFKYNYQYTREMNSVNNL